MRRADSAGRESSDVSDDDDDEEFAIITVVEPVLAYRDLLEESSTADHKRAHATPSGYSQREDQGLRVSSRIVQGCSDGNNSRCTMK